MWGPLCCTTFHWLANSRSAMLNNFGPCWKQAIVAKTTDPKPSSSRPPAASSSLHSASTSFSAAGRCLGSILRSGEIFGILLTMQIATSKLNRGRGCEHSHPRIPVPKDRELLGQVGNHPYRSFLGRTYRAMVHLFSLRQHSKGNRTKEPQ